MEANPKPAVLVVGAGPTGLVLALWLTRSGIPVQIVDKNSGPGQASRAMAVQARTLEFYRQLGIAEAVIQSGTPIHGIQIRANAQSVVSFKFNDIGVDLSPYPFVLAYPQDAHERLLTKELKQAGVEVRWNTELTDFQDNGHSVSATLNHEDKTETQEFAYLCGCDGVHSTVRQKLGLQFPGGTYSQLFYVADVQATGPALDQNVNISVSDATLLLGFPLPHSGAFRLVGVVPPELATQNPIAFDQIQPSVEMQIDVKVESVNWFSTYHVHHRVADRFRKERVFISGDAGHVHSPAGGQGMNTGIGDAVNLAWKLAAVLKGVAKPELLNSYEPERVTFARILVATTDRLFQRAVGAGLRSQLLRKFVVPFAAPLLLQIKAVRRAQFRLVSQVRVKYTGCPLSLGVAGKIKGGDRLPWLNGQDNFNPLNSLAWQLHLFKAPSQELAKLADKHNIAVNQFEWTPEAQAQGFAKDAMYLIRPDGHVSLVTPQQDPQALQRFLAKWFN